MARLFAYALVFGGVMGVATVFACASSTDGALSTSEAITPMAADAGDAGGGPAKQSVVISQIYGGGGDDGASFNHDFVEIFNRTQKPVVLDGMSLQLSSSATGNFNHAIPLTGTLAAGAYQLIQLGTNDDTVGDALPTPDQTDNTQIGSDTDGKVAISFAATALNCGGTSNLCATTKFMDLVGYGQVSQLEGLVSAPALDATHADLRNSGGCTDTDNNSSDFKSVTPPAPRSSATAAAACAVPVKDAGPPPDAAPPVADPPLGPESAFDGGYHPEGGAAAQSSGGDDGCAVAAVGVGTPSTGVFAGFAGLGLVALAFTRRRKRR